ncbi:bombyxin A-7-like [Battus philenor]|uniref:bombyxin A-7-like n=1 Tax=Battus philenor TaxID=42288 RepID=UPI0035D00677
MFQQTLFVITVALVSSSSGHIGGQISLQDVRDMKPQKYCGPNLAKTLALLCYEENAGVGKRSEYNSVYNAISSPFYKEVEVPYWPWISTEKSRSMGLPARGKRYVGVVDECCFKACSTDELMSYC